MGGPMPSLVSGNNSSTAAANRCAVEWRYTWSASGFLVVKIRRLESDSKGRPRSHRSPLTWATRASSASRGLIERATSIGRVPAGTLWTLPSGRVTWRLLIGTFRLAKQLAAATDTTCGTRSAYEENACGDRVAAPAIAGSDRAAPGHSLS